MADVATLTGLSMERLRAFCAIVEAGTMVAAAKSDPTKQSQLSRQMKELELAIGAKLFRKVGKSLELTDAGRKLALTARAFFRSLSDITSSPGKTEIIRIGGTESVLRWSVLPRVAEITTGNEQLALELRTFKTEETLQALRDGVIDVGVVRSDAVGEAENVIEAGVLEYCMVVSRRILPGKSAAGLQLLKTIPFAVLSGDGQLVKHLHKFARDAGWEMDICLRVENFTLLLDSLAYMDLAAVLPLQAADQLSKERYAIIPPPQGPDLKRRLAVVFDHKTAEFRPVIKKAAQKLARRLVESGGSA